jgi:hypothetical protein
MVYQEDIIRPEHRDAMKNIMDSGVFERMADRLTFDGLRIGGASTLAAKE